MSGPPAEPAEAESIEAVAGRDARHGPGESPGAEITTLRHDIFREQASAARPDPEFDENGYLRIERGQRERK